MNEELTGWFPGDVKPARKGVYERKYEPYDATKPPTYCRWDGRAWFSWSHSIADAAAAPWPSVFKSKQWRGLAKEPK